MPYDREEEEGDGVPYDDDREEDDDLTDFVACYNPQNRHERKET